MEIIRKKLRLRFLAQTDIEIGSNFNDCRKYAEWLETLAIQEINAAVVQENDMLRKKMLEAMNILDKGIAGTYTKSI